MAIAQRFTLPQPALRNVGFTYVVTVGLFYPFIEDAVFCDAASATQYALFRAGEGSPVAIGHTVHGWYDMFDDRADLTTAVETVRAWVADMENAGL